MAIELGGYGFSTCALTLAVLNGDISLLGGYDGACQPIHIPSNTQFGRRHSQKTTEITGLTTTLAILH